MPKFIIPNWSEVMKKSISAHLMTLSIVLLTISQGFNYINVPWYVVVAVLVVGYGSRFVAQGLGAPAPAADDQ